MGTPDGLAFAERNQLHDGLAIILKSDGEPVQVTPIPEDEQVLRSELESSLNNM